MRITGTLHSIGHHRVLMPGTNTSGMNEADMLKNFDGVLVNTEAKAIGMIGTTVDIYPHPVNGLVAGECTPENYAHALARLAHTEDHLAREVRSSQALASTLKEAHTRINLAADVLATAYYTDGAHHKQWVADQALRALLGDRYDAWAEKQVGCVADNRGLTGIAP